MTLDLFSELNETESREGTGGGGLPPGGDDGREVLVQMREQGVILSLIHI